jgi:FkbM family methyltransferase
METIIVIGAFDLRTHDDLFYHLIFKKNYKAIFVEPIEIYYNQLLENVKKLSGECYCEKIAISDKNDTIKLDYVNSKYLDLYPYYINGCSSAVENGTPLNTFLKEVPEEHRVSINVNTITFDQLCDKYNIKNIDYLQIDTEGYDERIVNTIDLNKYNIKKLKFETPYLSENFVTNLSNKYPDYKITHLECDVIFEL